MKYAALQKLICMPFAFFFVRAIHVAFDTFLLFSFVLQDIAGIQSVQISL